MSRRAEIEITSRGASKTGREIGGVSKRIDRMGKTARATSGAMRSMYGAIGGVGIAAGAKRIFDFQSSVAELAAKAKLSTEEAKAMADQILEVGIAHNIAKDDVSGALTVFQDFGGILKEGTTILDKLGKRATASSTSIKNLATVSAALVDSGLSPDESVMALDQLIAQADAGTVAMSDLSTVIAEVVKVGGTMGKRFEGMGGVKQIGELMQVAGSVFAGNAQQARTSVRALFRDLTARSKMLKKQGISVFDEKGMRNVQTIMKEIIAKTGGGTQEMSKIFTADSQAIAAAFASSFSKESGKFIGVVKKVSGATGDAATIDEMYKKRMGGIASEAVRAQQALKKMEAIFINVGSKLINWVDQNMGTAIATVAGGALGAKFLPKAIGRALSGGGGLGGASGGLGGGAPIPVYIVGSPSGAAGGFQNAGTQAGKAATKMGKIGSAASMVANNLGALAGSLGAGYAIGTALDSWLNISDQLSDWAFDIMNPGERDRRAKQAGIQFREKTEKKEQGIYASGKKKDAIDEIRERAKLYAQNTVGKRSGQAFATDVKRIGAEGGMSEDEIAKLLPEMRDLVSELRNSAFTKAAGGFFNIAITSPAGLDKPTAQVNSGPSFLKK